MENTAAIIAFAIALILVLLLSGAWIATALGLSAFILMAGFLDWRMLDAFGSVQFNTVNSFTFSAIPLFVFMGEMLIHGELSERLYKGANPLVSFLPGGLLHTNILSSAVFALVSGSSMATLATIGPVAYPELIKRGYKTHLLLGSLGCGPLLGILIPPSIPMIVYGSFVQESIGRLFMAGMIPGFTLAIMWMIYIAMVSSIDPDMRSLREPFSAKEFGRGALSLFPMVILILFVLGSIYLGIATPTEAAAIGAFTSAVIAAAYKKLTWQALKGAAINAALLTAWLMLLVIGAAALGTALSYHGVPQAIGIWVAASGMSPKQVFVLLTFVYIIMGMFIPGTECMLMTLPVVYPLMTGLGFDSVWLGVVMVIYIEMALITPPVGMNLYILYGITGKTQLGDLLKGIIPFICFVLLLLVLLVEYPQLALWLPDRMYAYHR